MLTGVQALKLATYQATAPWKVSDLKQRIGVPKLSLAAMIRGLEKKSVSLWLRVARKESIDWSSVKTLQDLYQSVIEAPAMSRAELVTLGQLLKSNGLDLVLSHTTWKVIGINGTIDAFGNAGGIHVLNETAKNVGEGEVALGTAIAAAGTLGAAPPVAAFGAGFAIGGAIVWILGALNVINIEPLKAPKVSVSGEDDPTDDSFDFPADLIGNPPKDIEDAIAAGVENWIDGYIVGDPYLDIPALPGAADGSDGADFPGGDGGLGFG
jgi:hypothetical protein